MKKRRLWIVMWVAALALASCGPGVEPTSIAIPSATQAPTVRPTDSPVPSTTTLEPSATAAPSKTPAILAASPIQLNANPFSGLELVVSQASLGVLNFERASLTPLIEQVPPLAIPFWAYSPDGELLAYPLFAASDFSIEAFLITNPGSSTQVRIDAHDLQLPPFLVWHPSGKLILIGNTLFDPADGRQVMQIGGPNDGIGRNSISSTGRWAVLEVPGPYWLILAELNQDDAGQPNGEVLHTKVCALRPTGLICVPLTSTLNDLSAQEIDMLSLIDVLPIKLAAWSPVGETLVVLGGDGGISLLDSEGRLLRNLAQGAQAQHQVGLFHDGLVWSPDGSQLAVLRGWQNNPNEFEPWHIYVLQADGNGETELTGEPYPVGRHPVWSPDGQWLLYIDGLTEQLILVSADGSERRLLSDDLRVVTFGFRP